MPLPWVNGRCPRLCACVPCGSNVVVNLSFRAEEAVRLGVDGHVCELQLTLDSFDEILVLPLAREPIFDVIAANSFAHDPKLAVFPSTDIYRN